MRRQFVLDEKTDRLLEELASSRAGNRSFVVREALQLYASIESRLDEIESEPKFRRMMDRSAADFRAGRTISHAEVRRRYPKSARGK
jgi:predicted transcriptional regulator